MFDIKFSFTKFIWDGALTFLFLVLFFLFFSFLESYSVLVAGVSSEGSSVNVSVKVNEFLALSNPWFRNGVVFSDEEVAFKEFDWEILTNNPSSWTSYFDYYIDSSVNENIFAERVHDDSVYFKKGIGFSKKERSVVEFAGDFDVQKKIGFDEGIDIDGFGGSVSDDFKEDFKEWGVVSQQSYFFEKKSLSSKSVDSLASRIYLNSRYLIPSQALDFEDRSVVVFSVVAL